jgi:CDP-glycerol glycerophosphotransferase (TagB/SpsB family)
MKDNSSFYISPKSALTQNLLEYIQTHYHNTTFLGYVDNYSGDSDVIKPNQIQQSHTVLLYSPNHWDKIFGWSSQKILLVEREEGAYDFRAYLPALITKRLGSIKKQLQRWLIAHIRWFESRSHIMFLNPALFDNNSRVTYEALQQEGSLHLYHSSDNLEVMSSGATPLYSWRFLWQMLRASVVVQDHIMPFEDKSLTESKTSLYLDHSIPPKRAQEIYRSYQFDHMISTSEYTTQLLKEVYGYGVGEYHVTGYPRDHLWQEQNPQSYKHLIGEYRWVVVYMPTFRENSFERNPLDFDRLNQMCQEYNILFVLKMHPFTKIYGLDAIKEGEYSHIKWFETSEDIHPFLAMSDMLITDYSGIYFDYLLLDRPILLFWYDKEAYQLHRGLIDEFDELVVGDIATEFDALMELIPKRLDEDVKLSERQKIKAKIHHFDDLNSHQRVIALLKEIA